MSGPRITLTTDGGVTIIDADGATVPLATLERRLHRTAKAALEAGANPGDVQAVELFAGIVRALARQQRRLDVLLPLARPRARGDAALDIVNLLRGVPRPKQAEVERLAGALGPRFKSARSLHAAIGKKTGLTRDQVRQVLTPPRRKRS